MTILPEMADLLARQREAANSPPASSDVTAIMAWLRSRHERDLLWMTPPASRDQVAEVVDLQLVTGEQAVPGRLYEPHTTSVGTLLWFHGGGWVSGSLETGDVVARAMCRRASVNVVSVDYRLAPESPWPAALEDASTAIEWVAEAVRSGRLSGPLVIGGDSAGGNIAAVTALNPASQQHVAGQLLVYPATRLDSDGWTLASRKAFAVGYGLELSELRLALESYLPRPADRSNERASPALSRRLSNAPPAVVVTAGCDLLRDDGVDFARKLRSAGVSTQRIELEGLLHGCLDMIGLSPAADAAATQVATLLRSLVRSVDGSTRTTAIPESAL